MKIAGLYIHIPFCLKKCNYCDFVSFSDKYEYVDIYFKNLICEINNILLNQSDLYFDTVFFGGGTPSSVNPVYIQRILDLLKDRILPNSEITIEINPKTVNEKSMSVYKSAGVNRVSIGVQSFDSNILKSLGRLHNENEAIEAVELSLKNDFKNISVDLMFGIPRIKEYEAQTIKSWENTLNIATKLNIQHISAYSLIIEEGTNFFNWNVDYIDDTQDRKMYHLCRALLEDKGFSQYEISNFASPGYESRHNLKYWECKEYYGVGLNAASCIDNVRFKNTNDFYQYINGDYTDKSETYVLTDIEAKNEFMMLGFRKNTGPDRVEFYNRFGIDYIDFYFNKIKLLEQKSLIEIHNNNYCLTDIGLDFANEVFREFIDN